MNATIKGGNLIITIPVETEVVVSSTGQSIIVANSHGFQHVAVDGKVMSINVLACQKNANAPAKPVKNGNGAAVRRTMPAGV